MQVHGGCGGHALGNPGTAGDTPTENQAVLLHRADLGRALRPTEFFGAHVETLDEVARREGQVLALVDLRLIQQAELDRIHVELDGQLIYRRLEREKTRHGARTAHGSWGANVAPDQAGSGTKVGRAVAVASGLAATLGVVVEDRGVIERVMHERDEFAVRRGPETDLLLGKRAMAHGLKHHVAGYHQLDRPVQVACRGGGDQAVCPGPKLASETGAKK